MAAEIAISMVGWFVSPIIGKVIDHVYQLLKEESKLKKDVVEELRFLEIDLSLISAGFLSKVEGKQWDDQAVHAWLRELKQIIYEAEDVLDLYETDIAVKQRSAMVSYFSKSKNSNLSVAKKIKRVRERLDYIRRQGHELGLTGKVVAAEQMDPTAEIYMERQTTSRPARKFVGRDEKTEEILNLLLPTRTTAGTSGDNNRLVIPVVGMGGMGKTALAKHLFNHEEVVEFFKENRVWVCVGLSRKVDRNKLLADIIRSLDEIPEKYHGIDSWSLDLLQKTFTEKISKRQPLLLVVDDAWDSDHRIWRDVLEPLRTCARVGNRVIVTTRNREVADCIRDRFEIIDLGILKDTDMLIILKGNAFDDEEDSSQCAELEPICQKIVGRLKGLPLASETIGSLLRGKNIEFWNSISEKLKKIDSNRLRIDSNTPENDFLRILMLSYECLPAPWKPCFSYLSLFPKDEQFVIDPKYLDEIVFSKDDIAKQWMAHKFIPTAKDADCGFKQLFNRSLLQMAVDSRGNNYFAMHDFIHDLAENTSKDEIIRVGDENSENHLPRHIRHVSFFQKKGNSKIPLELIEPKSLRSLILVSWKNIQIANFSSVLDSWFKSLIGLRVLVLCNDYISSLPDSIGNLRLLRLLDLRLKRLRKLPETISKLYNLQVLELCGCKELWSLPNSITELLNLRYLDVDEKRLLDEIPGIGNLTRLVQLRSFIVGRKDGYKIRELERLDRLCYPLQISGLENIKGKEEAQAAQLHKKEDLKELELDWGSEYMQSGEPEEMQSGVLEGLRPSNNLESLKISGYRGTVSPSWLDPRSLTSIGHLNLIDCKNVVNLPCLSTLRTLKITSCNNVVNLPFQSTLHTLKIRSCEALANIRFLPPSVPSSSLKLLHVHDCPCLDVSLRTLLQVSTTSLESVNISSYRHPLVDVFSGQTTLSQLTLFGCSEWVSLDLAELVSLKNLRISNCQGAFIGEVPQWLQQGSLSNLLASDSSFVDTCVRMFKEQPPPTNSMPQKSLHSLDVNESPLMVPSLCQSGLALPSLTDFAIKSDSSLDESMLSGCLSGLTALQRLNIAHCANIKSIPSLSSLTALQRLNIASCPNIKSISSLNGLEVEIRNCRNITSISCREVACIKKLSVFSCEGIKELDLQALVSLERLEINDCPSLMFRQAACSLLRPLEQIVIWGFNSEQLAGLSSLLEHTPPENMVLNSCTVSDENVGFGLQNLCRATAFEQLKIYCSKGPLLKLPPFNFLKKLSLCSCSNITSLPVLSSLVELFISDCHELVMFRNNPCPLLPSLESLIVGECGIQQLSDMLLEVKRSPLIKKLQIVDCHELECFEGELKSSFLSLSSLEKLTFEDCKTLRQLPADLTTFRQLRELNITRCWNMLTLPHDWLPSSLTHLYITACPILKKLYVNEGKSQHLQPLSHVSFLDWMDDDEKDDKKD